MNSNENPPKGSVKVSISFPPDLMRWIESEAKKDRRARSTWIQVQLENLLREKSALAAPSVKGNKRKAG